MLYPWSPQQQGILLTLNFLQSATATVQIVRPDERKDKQACAWGDLFYQPSLSKELLLDLSFHLKDIGPKFILRHVKINTLGWKKQIVVCNQTDPPGILHSLTTSSTEKDQYIHS